MNLRSFMKVLYVGAALSCFAPKLWAIETDKYAFTVRDFAYYNHDAIYKMNGLSVEGQPLLVIYANPTSAPDNLADYVFYVRNDPKTAMSIVMAAQLSGKKLMCTYYTKTTSPGPLKYAVSCNGLGLLN